MRDYRLYLKDILSAMESIEAFVEGMSFEEFHADDKTASAVIRVHAVEFERRKHDWKTTASISRRSRTL
jgi:uncharacterized protein with HEPN domain